MSMKFKSWVMDQYENFDEAVQRSADYVHNKLTDNSLEIADLKSEVRWEIQDELYNEEIEVLNKDIIWEHQFEQQREGACGVFEGSTNKEIREELFERVNQILNLSIHTKKIQTYEIRFGTYLNIA